MILKNKLFLLIIMLSLIPINTKSAKENSHLVSMAVITPLSSARWYNWGQIPAEVGPMNRKPNSQNPPALAVGPPMW
jgi:hypothetical protein